MYPGIPTTARIIAIKIKQIAEINNQCAKSPASPASVTSGISHMASSKSLGSPSSPHTSVKVVYSTTSE
jgi:hypothetical protein